MNILEECIGEKNEIEESLNKIKNILQNNIQHQITKKELLIIAKKKRDQFPEIWKDVRAIFGEILKLLKKSTKNKSIMENLYFREIEKIGKIYLIDNNSILRIPFYHEKVKKVSINTSTISNNFTVHVLNCKNEVFVFGSNSWGKAGIDYTLSDKFTKWTKVEIDNCKNIFSGYSTTFFLTSEGIFSCGCGTDGRLGIGEYNDSNNITKIDFDKDIKKIACGSTNSYFLDYQGKVYSCGRKDYLGFESEDDALVPKEINTINTIFPIVDISCQYGGYHVLCLDSNGSVFGWGHNRVGQLAKLTSQRIVTIPFKLEFGVPIMKISAGWGHSSFLDFDNRIYIVGRNSNGQIGKDLSKCVVTSDHQETPINISLEPIMIKGVQNIYSCQLTTYIIQNIYGTHIVSYYGSLDENSYNKKLIEIQGLENIPSHYEIEPIVDNVLFIT